MHLGKVFIYLDVHSDSAKHSVYTCCREFGLVYLLPVYCIHACYEV